MASRRLNEYDAELATTVAKTMPDGSKRPAASKAMIEKAEAYFNRGPSYHVQVLSALLSKESVEAYKLADRYLMATAPERRLAELRDKGNSVTFAHRERPLVLMGRARLKFASNSPSTARGWRSFKASG